MKNGDKVKYEAHGGRAGGTVPRSGVFITKIKPGESAREVFESKAKDAQKSALRIGLAQDKSKKERALVRLDSGEYKCPPFASLSAA